MIITVFGGSRPDKKTYDLAYKLGKKIASAGHTLKNGGNDGTMEASAKGAREKSGKVIGVVVESKIIPGLNKPNKYNTKVIKFKSYRDRVKELFKTDRVIVLPGQVGTLDELFVAWLEAIVKDLKPVILLGKKNKDLLDFLLSKGFVKDEHMPYIKYIKSMDEIDFLK